MFLVFKYTISVYGLCPKYQVFRDTKSIKAVNYWADSRAMKSADFKDNPQGAGHVISTSVLSTGVGAHRYVPLLCLFIFTNKNLIF